MSEVEKRSPMFSAGWIVVSLIAAASIAGTWLIYPIPGFCSLVYPGDCNPDARLLPAVIGTIVVVALWAAGTLLRSRRRSPTRPWPQLASALVVVAAVVVPANTLWSGGFMIPWW